MATQEPGQAPQPPALTSLPRVEDLPLAEQGYEPERVRESFEAFRRHLLQLQAQLRVLQAAGRGARVEPTGHAVRMDALHLIRAAAEFADVLERDALEASAVQIRRAEEEVRGRQRELQQRDGEIERYREESERQRTEIMSAAKSEARELLAKANADASQELREAEARADRLLEQARHQATELTNAARAEVEHTLEWSRTQASAILTRAQQGAEGLLSAAGLAPEAMAKVVEAIVAAAEGSQRQTAQPAPSRPVEAVAGPRPEPPTTPAPVQRASPSPQPPTSPGPLPPAGATPEPPEGPPLSPEPPPAAGGPEASTPAPEQGDAPSSEETEAGAEPESEGEGERT